MPETCIVFPPTKTGAQRRDFTIKEPAAGETLGWHEVEVGSDEGKLCRCKEHFENSASRVA